MFIRSHGITDRGIVRSSNEDAFFIDEAHRIFAVADGLGGLPGGGRCSRHIVELLEHKFANLDLEQEPVNLTDLVQSIHRVVAKEGQEDHPYTGTGSTLTLGQIIEDQLLIAHAGDSAAYLLRGEAFTKLTTDHTMEQELINRFGEAARESMPRAYPHTLTRCLGQNDDLKVDLEHIQIAPGDRLLICSDGLNKVLRHDEIAQALGQLDDPEKICNTLVKATHAYGAPDNITTIVVFIDS